jgi:hypothetical protein
MRNAKKKPYCEYSVNDSPDAVIIMREDKSYILTN